MDAITLETLELFVKSFEESTQVQIIALRFKNKHPNLSFDELVDAIFKILLKYHSACRLFSLTFTDGVSEASILENLLKDNDLETIEKRYPRFFELVDHCRIREIQTMLISRSEIRPYLYRKYPLAKYIEFAIKDNYPGEFIRLTKETDEFYEKIVYAYIEAPFQREQFIETLKCLKGIVSLEDIVINSEDAELKTYHF